MLDELKARVNKGDFGLLDNNYSWDDLKKQFLAWARQSIRSHADYARDIERFEGFDEPSNVKEITPERILNYRLWRLQQEGENGEPLRSTKCNGFSMRAPIACCPSGECL